MIGIETIVFECVKYNPLRGAKYIETPNEIDKRRACINIRNDDDYCFKYCIQCIVYDVINTIHPERFSHYKHIIDDKVNWGDLEFPLATCDVKRFEELNVNI